MKADNDNDVCARKQSVITIADSGIVPGDNGSTILWMELLYDDAYKTIFKFFIDHGDLNVTQSGQGALSSLCQHLGICEVNDTSEFIGKNVNQETIDDMRRQTLRHNKLLPRAAQLAHEPQPEPSQQPQQQPPDDRYVYVISCIDSPGPICKIGIAGSPEKRLKQLSTSSPHSLRLEFARFCNSARDVEAISHVHFSSYRLNGEWFSLDHRKAITFVNDNIDRMAA